MNIRKTPLFYLVLVLCIVGIPLGVYGLSLPGYDQLIGYAALVVVFGAILLLLLEQFLIKRFKPSLGGALLIDVSVLAGAAAILGLMMVC